MFPGIGINIRYDKRAGVDYAALICHGLKTIETRENARSLAPYIGRRVGIIRTGKGPAELIGAATISGIKEYRTAEEFDADYLQHKVPAGSSYHIAAAKNGRKYGFIITAAEMYAEPIPVKSRGIVARRINSNAAG